MRIQLPVGVYTKINTNPASFLIQNLSNGVMLIVVSPTQPDDSASADFELESRDSICNQHTNGIVWGKPSSKVPGTVGYVGA